MRLQAVTARLGGFPRIAAAAALCAAFAVTSHHPDADAAPSAACPAGVGYGGATGSGNAAARGGDGCVIAEYDAGAGVSYDTLTFTGALQQWTVPAGVTSVTFHLLGAGGGGGRDGNNPASRGGGGGYAAGTFVVTAGDVFDVIVGEGGVRQNGTEVNAISGATARRNVSFGGGASGQGMAGYGYAFAAGGGRSAVRTSGATDDLITAGGGGGGGYTAPGGPGGGTSGVAGSGVGGGGGTQAAGGAGAGGSEPGTSGIKYAGGYAGNIATGTMASEGGGGGGGWYGGGGGGDNGGGGGGSSYVAAATGGATNAGSGHVPGLVAPVNSVAPAIAGTAQVGATLTATSGTWNLALTSSWQWQTSSDGVTWANVPGADSSTFVVTSGLRHRVVETRSNPLGSDSATSNVITVVAPSTTTSTTSTSTTSTSTTSTSTTSSTSTTVPALAPAATSTTSPPPLTSTTTPSVVVATTSPTTAVTSTVVSTTTTLPDPLVPSDNSGRTSIADGAGQVYGMPEGSWVKATATGGRYEVRTSEGLVVSIGARARSTTVNDRGMPVFEPGDEFEVGAAGLLPGTETSTWMFSSPTLLGRGETDANGAMSSSYPIPASVAAGDHTAQLNGIAPDGTLRSVEVKVEVLAAPAGGEGGGAPAVPPPVEDGPDGPADGFDLGLVAAALVLASIRRAKNDDAAADSTQPGADGLQDAAAQVPEGNEEAGAIESVGAGYGARARSGLHDRFTPVAAPWLDGAVRDAAQRVSARVPVLARIIDDGSYLRALLGAGWLPLPFVAALLGVAGAAGVDHVVMTPQWWVVVAVVVIGCLDALSGLVFSAAFGVSVLVAGGFDGVASVRGFLGLAVMAFAPSLVAGAVRPWRRDTAGDDSAWNRTVDVTLISLFGAWALGTMYSALPTLTTYDPPQAGRAVEVQLLALVVLALRWLAENAAQSVVPARLADVENDEFAEPPQGQVYLSIAVRAAIFVFVAVSFIGNNWALWLGAFLFAYPEVVGLFTDRFPNVPALRKWLPQNLARTVMMLAVALWWGSLMEGWLGDSSNFPLLAFVVMGLPGHVLGVADWFGRDAEEWESTLVSRVAGVVLLVVGFLLATELVTF